jgi:hypothetical protein
MGDHLSTQIFEGRMALLAAERSRKCADAAFLFDLPKEKLIAKVIHFGNPFLV